LKPEKTHLWLGVPPAKDDQYPKTINIINGGSRISYVDLTLPKNVDLKFAYYIWYGENSEDVLDFEKQMRRKVHYVIEPDYLWTNIYELARTQNNNLLKTLEKGFKYIENESFDRAFQGLFSEINLNSDKKRISRPTT